MDNEIFGPDSGKLAAQEAIRFLRETGQSHDETIAPSTPSYTSRIGSRINNFVTEYTGQLFWFGIPMLGATIWGIGEATSLEPVKYVGAAFGGIPVWVTCAAIIIDG